MVVSCLLLWKGRPASTAARLAIAVTLPLWPEYTILISAPEKKFSLDSPASKMGPVGKAPAEALGEIPPPRSAIVSGTEETRRAI